MTRQIKRLKNDNVHNTAELDAYNECGFEEYEFMASLGERTCEVCGGMDGKRIKLTDKQFGVNFPPLHPNCRCTTIAFDPDDDLSDFKAEELEYEWWYAKYVEGREQPKLESKGGAEIDVPSGKPVPVSPTSEKKNAVQTLTTGGDSGIIKGNDNRTADDDVHYIGKINLDIFKCVSDDILTDEVILTDERMGHIIDRRGQEFYDKYHRLFGTILSDPDYIFKDAPTNTAIVCKRFFEHEKNVNIVLRLVVEGDNPNYKNSILTVIGENNRRFEQRLRNNTPIYVKKNLDKTE